jgi:hypothetical protein
VSQGSIDSAEATTAVFQGVSVLAMAAMPFGIRNLDAVTLKLACWLLAIVLFGLNLLNALDAASHARANATGVSRGTIASAAGLNSRIAELRKSRAQVPQFQFTSPAQATAAQEAVKAAETARDAECTKVGQNCRKRTDEAATAAEKLSGVLSQRALTERAESLDGDIATLEKELTSLGPIPVHADDTASKAARLIGAFVALGSNADEEIAEWRPIAFAIGIELLALIGPIGMMAAVSPPSCPVAQQPMPERNVTEKQHPSISESSAALAPAPEKTAVAGSAATPAKLKKTRKIKSAALAEVGDVREWHKSRTAARPGNLLRVNECYAAYVQWCKSRDLEAASLTKFGGLMKGELGISYLEKSKRGYYQDIALTGAALKIVTVA